MSPSVRFPVSLLCVDDDPASLDILSRLLSHCVDTLYFAENGREGYDLFLEKRPDIVLTDLLMPSLNGLEMSRMIREIEPKAPVILLTSCGSIDFLVEAIDTGVTQFLSRPILKEKLMTAMRRCYETIDLERRLKEEQERAVSHLLRAQKLESLGVLASGLAHNINNILTVVMGNVHVALTTLGPDSPVARQLKNIDDSAVRAAKIVQQMFEFSGKGGLRVARVNLNDIIENMQYLLQVTIPNTIVKVFVPAEEPCFITGDVDQLQQVVMNLVINAVEAIGDHEGAIGIATGRMTCSASFLAGCWFNDGASEGEYFFLEVSDNGCGMDGEILARLFDPFFSTKFIGRGLGMAAVLGIIRLHKGAIQILSKPGVGSTFQILLPALPQPVTYSKGDAHV
jgi:signal transduction histidine kinase